MIGCYRIMLIACQSLRILLQGIKYLIIDFKAIRTNFKKTSTKQGF